MPPTHLPILETSEQTMLRAWVELAGAVYKLNRRIVATLTQQDVTLPQFDVMATLRFSEGVTQQHLAERLLVTKGNVCGLLDRLERLKWVERRPDRQDARANRLHLTPAGRRKIDALLPQHDAIVIGVLSALSAADLSSLRRMLRKLNAIDELC